MIAYGIGAADQDTLDMIGEFRVFLGRDGIRVGTALTLSVVWSALRRDHVVALPER